MRALTKSNPIEAKGMAVGAVVLALAGVAGYIIYNMMKKPGGKPEDAEVAEVVIKVSRAEEV